MIEQDLTDLGFDLVQQRRDGTRTWSKRGHRYLVYWLTTHADQSAELSWELALGEYFVANGFAFSAQDELSLFVFPKQELVGRADGEWVRRSIEQVEDDLGSIDLARGTNTRTYQGGG